MTVHVCPIKDSECGHRPDNWCDDCPLRAERAESVPFKPETWPVDADGFRPDLCTECGTPVRYGSRHATCGDKAMAATRATGGTTA